MMFSTAYIDTPLREESLQKIRQNYYLDVSLTCRKVEQGIVLPYRGVYQGKTAGGVIDNAGVFIDNSGLHENHGCGYPVVSKDIVKKEKNAIYLGVWFPIWGHCITDNIKKLWFLKTIEAQELINGGAELVYIVMMNDRFKLPKSFIDLLQSLNIKISQLKQITSPTQYDVIYIPENSLFRKGKEIFYTKEFLETRNDILANVLQSKKTIYNKIYFSRSRLKNGKQDFGEKRIEDVFRYLGYKIIYPEKKSFAEQIALLQNCTHFAATEGSTSHNSIFCKKRTKVTILRKAAYINEYQFLINAMCSLDVIYIDTHLSIFVNKNRVWNGPFFLYLNNNLLRYANIPLIFNNFSLKSFKCYAQLAYPQNKDNMQVADSYYYRLIEEINMSFFCKGLLKRIVHVFLSKCNLFFWVPIIKKFIKE